MGTAIRPEISENNKYWIEKHRYYELRHFCLQYPIWKKAHAALSGLSKRPADLELFIRTNKVDDPTAQCAIARTFYTERINMVETTARSADVELADYILRGVTEEVSYDWLRNRMSIPCSRDTYYDRYRRFFWLLNKERQ